MTISKEFHPFISICIPAYKRIQFLKRLLNSIQAQSFTNFEVVVTDDSQSDEVAELCDQYHGKFSLTYHKNTSPLGTPENWNQAIRMAKGQWVKLMHDDDWFATTDSLKQFAGAIKENPGIDFFFSTYNNVHEETGKSWELKPNKARLQQLRKNPAVLLGGNIIGPPSVTMYKNDDHINYDSKLKWLVDIDFYIRYLKGKKFHCINSPLVNIGISESQVTKSTFRVVGVEIPENFVVLEKHGAEQLKNILVYDAWWRLIRNLNINSLEEIRSAGYNGEIPDRIKTIVKFQKAVPGPVLKNGMFSKALMSICFLLSR